MKSTYRGSLLLFPLVLMLSLPGCAPRIRLQSSGPSIGTHEEQRRLNREAFLELMSRYAESRDEAASNGSRAGIEATPSSARPVLPVTVLTPSPTAAEEGEGIIPRGQLERYLGSGPYRLVATFPVEPVMDRGDFRGFRLEGVNRAHSPELVNCGLHVGDVILAVNGENIGQPEAFMRVWDSLLEIDHLQVDIMRQGRAQRLSWIIQ